MVGEVPPDASEMAVSLHALVGFPIPLWSHGDVDEPEGTVVLVPFARPGLRIESPGEVRGYHTVGVMLKWTSYGF